MASAAALTSASTPRIHFVDPSASRGLTADLIRLNLAVLELDGARLTGEQELFDELATQLALPDPLENWQDLQARLVDPGRFDSGGLVLLVANAREFWTQAPALAGALVESWLRLSDALESDGQVAHLVFLMEGALEPFRGVEKSIAIRDFIDTHPVNSTVIRAIGYDPGRRILEVEFLDRRVYRYFGVPDAIYREFDEAESLGVFFNVRIRGEYRYRKVSK